MCAPYDQDPETGVWEPPPPNNDQDGDGCADDWDAFPGDPSECYDTDGDGVGDNRDRFPNDPYEWDDDDGDGQGNNSDPSPVGIGVSWGDPNAIPDAPPADCSDPANCGQGVGGAIGGFIAGELAERGIPPLVIPPGQCPSFSTDFTLGGATHTLSLDAACDLINPWRSMLSILITISWAMLAFYIVLEA